MSGRRGLVWPLLLIAVGAVLLLRNFGYIGPFSAVALIALWPLILIVVGIDIAIGRRWPLAALGLDVAVIAAGLALVAAQPAYPRWIVFGGSTGAQGVSHASAPRGSAQSLAFHLNGGAGTFRVAGGASDLVEVSSDQPSLTLRRSGVEHVDVRVDQSDQGVRFGPGAPASVDAHFASDVPTTLEMNAGAGDFTVDLSGTRITDARINVGAASLRLVLPKTTGEVSISVGAGASSVVIEVPDGVEARISTTGALMSLRSENPRLASSETAGYASASDRVSVRVTAGATSVVIR